MENLSGSKKSDHSTQITFDEQVWQTSAVRGHGYGATKMMHFEHNKIVGRRFGLSALGRNRTCDQEIRRLLLYPLSYEGMPYQDQGSPSLPHE